MFGIKKRKNGSKFSAALQNLFGTNKNDFDDLFFDDLADSLVESDLGAKLSEQVCNQLRAQQRSAKITTREQLILSLKGILQEFLCAAPLHIGTKLPNVIMMIGVNGVGKTTSLAKLAYFYQQQGLKKIVVAAGDTFRAAAIEQLEVHCQRLGLRFVAQHHGSDPAAVLHDAVKSAQSRSEQLVLFDTAGRMHSRENLVRQLDKINRVLGKLVERDQQHNLLTIDATTGQNALQQAEIFHQAVGIDAIVLSKMDSSAAGGAVIAIGQKLQIPIAFYADGECYHNFHSFEVASYLDSIFAGF